MQGKCLETSLLLLGLIVNFAAAKTRSGRVVEDNSGNSLSSAEIKLAREGNPQLIADLETESNGQFELPDLNPGVYRIEVSKPGYVTTTVRIRANAEDAESFVVRLIRCGVIAGRVLDPQGEPLQNATVYAIRREQDGTLRRPAPGGSPANQSRVDPNGGYRLYNLPPGDYAVAVTYGAFPAVAGPTGSGVVFYPPDAEPRIFRISGGEEYSDNDFTIVPGQLCRLAGHLEAPANRPGYWVALTSVSQPAFATAVTQTDPAGRFHFEGIPAGSYSLFASGPSSASGPLGAILHRDAQFGRMNLTLTSTLEDVAIPVAKGAAASFILRASPSPSPGCSSDVQLHLSAREDWGVDLHYTVKVAEAKPHLIETLAPASYLLTAEDSDENCYAALNPLLNLTETSTAPITITLAPKGSIHGSLTGDKVDASKLAVLLLPRTLSEADEPLKVLMCRSDESFLFDHLKPGTYLVAVRPANRNIRWFSADTNGVEVSVEAGRTAEVQLKAKQ